MEDFFGIQNNYFPFKKIIALIFVILILLLSAIGYFFYSSSQRLILINNSKKYELIYRPSPPFTEFLDDVADTGTSRLSKTKSVKKVKIYLEDKNLPREKKYTTFPLEISLNESLSTNDTLAVNLYVDPNLADSYTQNDLNKITLQFVMLTIFNAANTEQVDQEDIDYINDYIRTNFKVGDLAFFLVKKKN